MELLDKNTLTLTECKKLINFIRHNYKYLVFNYNQMISKAFNRVFDNDDFLRFLDNKIIRESRSDLYVMIKQRLRNSKFKIIFSNFSIDYEGKPLFDLRCEYSLKRKRENDEEKNNKKIREDNLKILIGIVDEELRKIEDD